MTVLGRVHPCRAAAICGATGVKYFGTNAGFITNSNADCKCDNNQWCAGKFPTTYMCANGNANGPTEYGTPSGQVRF